MQCGKKFIPKNNTWVEKAYDDYVFGKQSLKQLKVKYNKSIPTIRKEFALSSLPNLKQVPVKKLNVVFDCSMFGKGLWLMLFRANGFNLYYDFVEGEKLEYYEKNLLEIKQKKHQYLSFTVDGKPGVIKLLERMFPYVPVQLCHFHFVKNICKYTTKRPKSICGKNLLQLVLSIGELSERELRKKLVEIKEVHSEFLSEKNEQGKYKHRRIRAAIRAIERALPYLFTFQKYRKRSIPSTTNSCEGYFSHLKSKLRNHTGLSPINRIRAIISLLSS